MKKRFIGAIIATLIGLMIAIGASARQQESGPSAGIECGAGNSGYCFIAIDIGHWGPDYVCEWTGKRENHCNRAQCLFKDFLTIF